MRTVYRAGAPWRQGTTLPTNVTGECPHEHRTPAGAQACLDRMDRAIKAGHGKSSYCDRIVMVEERDGATLITRYPHREEA